MLRFRNNIVLLSNTISNCWSTILSPLIINLLTSLLEVSLLPKIKDFSQVNAISFGYEWNNGPLMNFKKSNFFFVIYFRTYSSFSRSSSIAKNRSSSSLLVSIFLKSYLLKALGISLKYKTPLALKSSMYLLKLCFRNQQETSSNISPVFDSSITKW